jgi:hypothetical protein
MNCKGSGRKQLSSKFMYRRYPRTPARESGFRAEILTQHFFIRGVGWDWVHLVHRPVVSLVYQPRMIEDGECRAVDVMIICRRNQSTVRKHTIVPLCPSKVPHELTWHRTPATNRLSPTPGFAEYEEMLCTCKRISVVSILIGITGIDI